MIEKEILELLPKLFNSVDVQNITIRDAISKVENDSVKEYDIIIDENLYHSQIQELDRVLSDYDEIEMRHTDDGMIIASMFAKELSTPNSQQNESKTS